MICLFMEYNIPKSSRQWISKHGINNLAWCCISALRDTLASFFNPPFHTHLTATSGHSSKWHNLTSDALDVYEPKWLELDFLCTDSFMFSTFHQYFLKSWKRQKGCCSLCLDQCLIKKSHICRTVSKKSNRLWL